MITDGKPSITTINNFLGLSMNETGETQLKLGEASYIKNFRITKDLKLEKMFGYIEQYTPGSRVRANWVGNLNGTEMNVYVAGGKIYKNGTQIGTLTDDTTTIFEFNKKLYFLNGHEYKTYNGTTVSNVSGYIPTIKISCTPAGVGDDYEPINVLTGYRKVSFSADGVGQTFQLPEKDITLHLNSVWINGELATEEATYNAADGIVYLHEATPPAAGTDNVVIQYEKNTATDLSSNIIKNRYAQKYGLASDTRVFLYGNPDAKNRIYFSDLGNGVPNVEYFPANNFIDVGSSNYEVTDISRQYDRLIISKPNEAYYALYNPITDTTGETIITFPTYPLNDAHGMIAKGQGQVLDNYVTTVDYSGIIQWINTQSKDERNASIVSTKVAEWLQSRDMMNAVTLDYQEEKEYWVAIDKEVLVYNYANGTFYTLELPDYVRTLTMYQGSIYMGTNTSIMKWQKNLTSFAGETIEAVWHSGYYDFEAEYKRKTMRVLWVTIKPQDKNYIAINYISDRNSGVQDREFSSMQSETFTYGNLSYDDWTYMVNTTVKPFKIKLKAKKFAFLKLIIKNDKPDHKLILDSISIQKSYGGFVK